MEVWDGLTLFPVPETDGKNKMRENQHNSETLEWLFENKFFEKKTSPAPQHYKEDEGKCAAVYKYMTLMSVVQYHNDE
jgi:hypothetical protein